jgi:hypothetical protein
LALGSWLLKIVAAIEIVLQSFSNFLPFRCFFAVLRAFASLREPAVAVPIISVLGALEPLCLDVENLSGLICHTPDQPCPLHSTCMIPGWPHNQPHVINPR